MHMLMRRLAFAAVLLVTGAGPAWAAEGWLADTRAVYFSTGFRVSGESTENRLQLGAVYRCETGWCLAVEEFSGHDNLPRRPLPQHHEMRAPYRTPTCTDEHLTTIDGSLRLVTPVRVEFVERGFRLLTAAYEYTWRRDDTAAGGYLLVAMKDLTHHGDAQQPVGFAYEAEESAVDLPDTNALNDLFDGEIYHKDTHATVQDEWAHQPSSIDFRKFKPGSTTPAVRGLTQPGHPDVIRRIGKELWVQHSMLLLPQRSEWLRYVLHEYGHDFNRNGCFDEFGHNKLMLPIRQARQVIALVYIEYSPDKFDGIPMISVGRYFRHK